MGLNVDVDLSFNITLDLKQSKSKQGKCANTYVTIYEAFLNLQ
jgi:hypothetical protein